MFARRLVKSSDDDVLHDCGDTGNHKKNRVVTTKRIEPAQFDSHARATDNLT
jgi:hypothetical protein